MISYIKLFIFLLIVPFYLRSQDTLKVTYNIAITGFYNNGNNNNLFLNNRNNLNLSKRKIKNNTIYNYSFGDQGSATGKGNLIVNQNEHFFNNTISYSLVRKLYLMALVEGERSFMRSIEIRDMYGLGVGYNISKVISISDLFAFDNTIYTTKILNVKRNSFRLKLNFNSNKISIKNETYIQPDLEMKYFRFRSNLTITYSLTKIISFNFNVQDSYEQYVIRNKLNNDFNISFGLSIKNR
jgi:hypothetical protein